MFCTSSSNVYSYSNKMKLKSFSISTKLNFFGKWKIDNENNSNNCKTTKLSSSVSMKLCNFSANDNSIDNVFNSKNAKELYRNCKIFLKPENGILCDRSQLDFSISKALEESSEECLASSLLTSVLGLSS